MFAYLALFSPSCLRYHQQVFPLSGIINFNFKCLHIDIFIVCIMVYRVVLTYWHSKTYYKRTCMYYSMYLLYAFVSYKKNLVRLLTIYNTVRICIVSYNHHVAGKLDIGLIVWLFSVVVMVRCWFKCWWWYYVFQEFGTTCTLS